MGQTNTAQDERTIRKSVLGGTMGKLSIIKEFWGFMIHRKKWWLAPIIIFLVLLGALIVFTESSAVAPFIYTLF